MFMKKKVLLTLLILAIIPVISAINLDISSEPVQDTIILDLDEQAIFDLTIRNLGENDTFEIYSLIGIDITPKETIRINSGETKKVIIKLTPQNHLKTKRDAPLTFEYKIKNSKNEIQKQTLTIKIIDLESAFLINPKPISPNSESITISIKNNINYNFTKLDIKLISAFFEEEKALSLEPKQEKEIITLLDKEKVKTLNAGNFLMNSEITVNKVKANIESQIKFLEQEGIETIENKEKGLIQRKEFVKRNTGNIRKAVEIQTERGFISSLFTSTNPPPTKTEFKGYIKVYTWERELIPNEELKIVIKTNWLVPIVILILIIIIIILTKKAIYTHLILRKKVSFVKTKGGQFALKVTLRVQAKSFIERIKVIDKLPHLVKLYEKFGAIPPDRIDLNNRRLDWNIESLNKDEVRIFTYIIYSKIGVVGRFELPEAKAFYEKEGNVKETISNRSFYINEPGE